VIVTVGSINMDLVVRLRQLPKPGETVMGSDYQTHFGGKGANQAVAAARGGAQVRMIGAVGDDDFGARLREGLSRAGVDVSGVRVQPGKSGVAFIAVDDQGQNNIIVSPGANAAVTGQSLSGADFEGAAVVLLQMEIPFGGNREAIRLGKAAGARVLLNLAPAMPLPPQELEGVDLLLLNETEAAVLAGSTGPGTRVQAGVLARKLLDFAPTVMITLGAQGVAWASRESGEVVEDSLPAFEVEPVDSTGAGDAFAGMLAARLAGGEALTEAARWASAAGALATTREGAQPSLPSHEQVEAFLINRGSLRKEHR